MVTCAAKGCRNSNSNGTKMCNFPRDPQRLRTWLANCGMENKKFNYCAALCEVRYVFLLLYNLKNYLLKSITAVSNRIIKELN